MKFGCSKCDALLKAAEEHEWKLAILLGEWRITLAELRGAPTDPLASAECLAAKLREEKAIAQHTAIDVARKLAETELEARKLAEADSGRRLAEAAREARLGVSADERAIEAERRLTELVEKAEKDKSALMVVAAAKSAAEDRAEEAERRLAEAMERAERDAKLALEPAATAKETATEIGLDAVKDLEEELEEGCRTIFALCDPEGDRSVTVSSVVEGCRKYDHIARFCNVATSKDGSVETDQIYRIFGEPTKRLDYDRFKDAITKIRGVSMSFMDEASKIDTMYSSIDADGGGTITMHELAAFCIKHPKVAEMGGLGRKKQTGKPSQRAQCARKSTDVLFHDISEGAGIITRAKFHEYVREHRGSLK
eukprot:TRINITY_DN17239_c0_g1_i1.p1 TRINITY_DN17239_c0_g1~~TRINITY_DN17239_c0_g1_i1.p1  ORF type:complete len:368 (-),score=63.89 TRINITY_DN17239_c0_g1_i1:67-1170(-)